MKQLHDFKIEFDIKFNTYLQELLISTNEYNPDFKELGEHFYLLCQGGKRIRPYICLLAYETGGGKGMDTILHALFALELFQISALIHDDIMDAATTRHGVSCIHEKFDYKQALLIGNLCTVWAVKAMNGMQETSKEILEQFIILLEETNIGQMIDTALLGAENITRDTINRSIELKTARYTFIYPTLIGFSYAANHAYDEDVIIFGHYLGSAFQRLNDVADIMSKEEDLGKRPCADISECTPTHLLFAFNEHATEIQKQALQKYIGTKVSDEDIIEIQKLFIESGACRYEKYRIESLFNNAESIIKQMNILSVHKNNWLDCVTFLRTKLHNL